MTRSERIEALATGLCDAMGALVFHDNEAGVITVTGEAADGISPAARLVVERLDALRAALASPPEPAEGEREAEEMLRQWLAGAFCAYRVNGLDVEAAHAKAAWLRKQVESGRQDPVYLWELDAPAPSTSRDDAVAADHALAPVAVEGMIRDAALEEAARVVDAYAHEAQDWFRETSESRWTTRLAARIRSLKGQPPTAAPATKETK